VHAQCSNNALVGRHRGRAFEIHGLNLQRHVSLRYVSGKKPHNATATSIYDYGDHAGLTHQAGNS